MARSDLPKLNWNYRNPKSIHNSEKHEKYKREYIYIYQIKEQESKNHEPNPKSLVCIYCEKSGHEFRKQLRRT